MRPALAVLVLAGGLAGCMTDRDVTGSIGASNPADLQASSADLAKRYDANPGDRTTALRYAATLRAQSRTAQAVAVLENLAIKNPYDTEILAAYGKALVDSGRAKEAADVLARAHTPDRPDWSVLSAQGSAADQLGDTQGAQGYYDAALKVSPDNPNVLSNLGLSYALSKQLPLAEETLRRAAAASGASSRVRQNLAFVLALEGKFTEAESVARTDMSPADASASIASVRDMIAQSSTWKNVQKPTHRASPHPTAS